MWTNVGKNQFCKRRYNTRKQSWTLLVSDGLKTIRNQISAYFKVLCQYLPDMTEENHSAVDIRIAIRAWNLPNTKQEKNPRSLVDLIVVFESPEQPIHHEIFSTASFVLFEVVTAVEMSCLWRRRYKPTFRSHNPDQKHRQRVIG